jgi:N-acetyl-anhydromuramyl-L-alanine amidase AmpD
MRLPRFIVAAALLAALLPAGAHAAQLRPPPVDFVNGAIDFTPAHRKPQQIRLIVIHVTEGSFFGTLSWLRSPLAHASTNFVVSRGGHIAELVPKRDIAWHAGNWAVNKESVGIEHVGVTGSPVGFTTPEYKASARLVAYLVRTSFIPIDRQHIIGHSQVPDPGDPLLGGGIDNHTDPGPFWNWSRYLRLVRQYAFPVVVRHVKLGVESSTLHQGETVTGTVPWRVQVKGPVTRVAFLVDGRERWSDSRRPFAYAGGRGLRTLAYREGAHKLEVRVYSRKGSWTRDRFVVRVRNVHYAVAVSGIAPSQPVAGTVPVQALAEGAQTVRVALLLDGREIDHDTSRPFVFHWDTTRIKDGKHVLSLRARARGGYFAIARTTVVVANSAPAVSFVSPLEQQPVSGQVAVGVQTSGQIVRVDFLVDMQPVASANAAPWSFTWDTTSLSPGDYLLTARAVAKDGSTAESSIPVRVGAPSG